MSHVTPRQTDARADGQMCRHGCSSHTHTDTPARLQTTQPPPPGVWAKTTLEEANMVSDNEERKPSNQRQIRRSCTFSKGKGSQIPWLPSQLSPWGRLRIVFVVSGHQSPEPRTQPRLPPQQPREACGGKNIGSHPGGLQAQQDQLGDLEPEPELFSCLLSVQREAPISLWL